MTQSETGSVLSPQDPEKAMYKAPKPSRHHAQRCDTPRVMPRDRERANRAETILYANQSWNIYRTNENNCLAPVKIAQLK